jgi:hypothetical protein
MVRKTSSAAPIAYLYVPSERNVLLEKPESGPGFQIVSVRGGSRLAGAVPPGEYIVFEAGLFVCRSWIEGVRRGEPIRGALSYEEFVERLRPLKVHRVVEWRLLRPPRGTFVIEGTTRPKQRFWRFCWQKRDPRIHNGRLDTGAYVASHLDRQFVNTGLGAVGRYALPNYYPAIYAAELEPRPGTGFLAGTVRPANGQAGGGVEAILDKPARVVRHVRLPPL